MLSTVLPSEKNIKVQLLVSRKKNEKICRYKKAICLPILYSRKNIYRFLNFFKIIKFLKKTIKKDNKHKIILFVRNEPIYLIACSFVKQKKVKLIFQSSFPHEVVSGYFIKKMIAKIIFKICENKIDSLLAVSPKGLKRVSTLFPKIKDREFIPLLADFFPSLDHHKISKKKVKFIYIGSHTHHRKLDVVLRAIVKSYDKGLKAQFKFIGGDFSDIERLRGINGVKELQEKKNFIFIERIPRKKIWSELRTADIGLCLIHFASVGVSPQVATYEELQFGNVSCTLSLLNVAKNAGVSKIIMAGSYSEYGLSANNYDFIPADASLRPTTPYASSKAAAFDLTYNFCQKSKISLIYNRIFSAYGDGQFEGNLWPSLKKAAINNSDFPMTTGNQIRDFIAVEEVANKFFNDLNLGFSGGFSIKVKNICSGKGLTILDFAKFWWKTWDAKGKLLPGKIVSRQNEPIRFVGKP